MSHTNKKEVKCNHAHCRCMNLGGQCPNLHYADCLKKVSKEKAEIDVILKGNTTPEWIYEFNKFLIDERTTGEIIKFIDELLHQELQKSQEESWIDGFMATAEGYNGEYCSGNGGNYVTREAVQKIYLSELDQPTV